MEMKKQRILCLLTAAIIFLSSCGTAVPEDSSSSKGSESTAGSATVGASESTAGILHVYCFAAGKADAILLYTDKSAVLIDTGDSGFGKKIVDALEQRGISSLDYLILTHFDQDHVGGAAKVLNSIRVKQVLQSDCLKDSSEYEKTVDALKQAGLTPVTVRETTAFTLDSVTYTVDPPKQETYSVQASNNSSLIISAVYGERRFLFAGDAADARLQEFVAEDNGSYDFLKVPYHGSYQQTLPAFFTAVRPAYAVITCSNDEPEDDATMKALADTGTEVFLTRIAPVLAESDGTSLTVQYAD